jgi:uncharacterized membrane protein YccC
VAQGSGRLSWPTWAQARIAILECAVLAVACMITYWLTRSVLTRVYSISRADDLLGALWAVVATIFVCRDSYEQSVAAAVSRMSATAVSFVLCLIYLIFLPVYGWGVALLIGLSALAVMLIGRPGDAVTAAITTAVVMLVAAVTPRDAWEQPILRFVDTLIGVAIGVAAAWIGLRLLRPRIETR